MDLYRSCITLKKIPLFILFLLALESNNIKIKDSKIIIDGYCKTSIPFVYALGRITQYKEELFAAQMEQKFFNQIEIGNQLAINFIHERRTGIESSMLDATFVKPIFRQSILIEGLLYAGLCKPGSYVSRGIRKNLRGYGHDLVTCDNKGEYCRVILDRKGIITEINCITRKYNNLEFLYRIYGLHEAILNNLLIRHQEGEIENLLDYFCQKSFAVLLNDQFIVLKDSIRKKNMDCLKEFLQNKTKIDRAEIQEFLKKKGMHEVIQKDLIQFIGKQWAKLHAHYALPADFSKLQN